MYDSGFLLFLLAALLLIVVPAWWIIVYLFVGPDIRYVSVKQDVTINGDIHLTATQAPAPQYKRVGGAARQALPPPINRVIGVSAPTAAAAWEGDRLLPDKQGGEMVTASWRVAQ